MNVPLVEELEWNTPHELFRGLAAEPFALFLDSATAAPGKNASLHGRWSFLAFDPFDRLTLRAEDGTKPFDLLKQKLASLPALETCGALPPFPGGAAGFFGYGLGRTLETLPPERRPFAIDDQQLPDMALGFYDVILAFDMMEKRAYILSTGLPESNATARTERAKRRIAECRQRLSSLQAPPERSPAAPYPLVSNFTREGYERAVARVVDYIHAGDIFQANLSQRFETQLAESDDPYALYLRLRKASPAPFSAFFNFGEGAVVSSSPERFLHCRASEVETKPIKGTRPRGATPEEDRRLAEELLASEKDRAENIMIVDLLRNDLSRTCEDDSVIVEKLCELESFANVHHLVSTVRGKLRADTNAVDLLAACFPGGSVTGAPKRRAMEIIAELEPTVRGPYCGAIGYLGTDGGMDTSIAIRTIVVKGARATFQAGGGIVADSVPAAEYEETLAKARDMRSALSGEGTENDELVAEERG
ncbi:aminodeoxychorismate synthase component I [Parvibaculum sp.]|uniref:aminodeoxychorismate synthase component I n=1 Tax=Parvibaculum sp. TaxID=2024848 RepID=UPI001B09959C|nr:aminodeoxychorismate synthase component I [Parvibaculum sp.]MBO6636153.1 aminodeoxychorismate synthase component I [Parvibaculum sp.]MBO6677141.1 aminodeoxychorismate synthase component I [Parvibaculum sp.]MBO6683900.1 aminodeoxychorismate synthase component I [Parvibaculum sp.]MBO6905097.1 aminodeoxychorismate synthase component I [Parvibaculum sp.]